MADEDAPDAPFDVRLDWPEDELRDRSATATPREPAVRPPPPMTITSADLEEAAVRGTVAGALEAMARQVHASTAASVQEVAALRSLVNQNGERLRRIGARLEEIRNEAATDDGLREFADEIREAVARQRPPAAATAQDLEDLGHRIDAQLDVIATARGTAPTDDDVRSMLAPMAEDVVTAVHTLQEAVVRALDELRQDLVQLKRRVAVRTSASGARQGLDDEDVEKIVDAVVRRLDETFERVPDDGPVAPPPRKAKIPATKRAARPAKRGGRPG